MRGGDGHSRLFLFLVAFALLVFASTVCLLAAGLAAAHAGDGEVAEGAAGGPAHAWQQPEQPRAPAPIPVPASGTGTVRGPPARIGAGGGGGRTAAEGTPPGAIAAPRLVGGGGFAPVSSDAAGRGGLLPPAPAVVPRLPAGTPDHLSPAVPPLPPFQGLDASEGDRLVAATLSGSRPTVGGVHTILQRFLLALHRSNRGFQTEAKTENDRDSLRDRVVKAYFDLATEHLVPLDKAYRGRNVFPVREDGSIFMSLASFRDHLLGATLKDAFRNAEHPDKIYIGAVVQNCFGDEYTCRTGAQVVGKDRNGRDMTKVSDAPPDKNGVEEFCSDPDFRGYCEAGQVRVLYVNETESLGPAVARYYASKLWGGENYYFQADAHLRFAKRWDARYIDEIKAAKSYPMAVLSSYPPGFSEGDPAYVGGTTGSRLCTCTFSTSDVEEHIIRINTGSSCSNHDVDGPTQIPFIAAGFFFARGEFLKDVPFGEYLHAGQRATLRGYNGRGFNPLMSTKCHLSTDMELHTLPERRILSFL